MIAAIILAAGRSTRMGRPKLALEIAGRTVIQHVLGHVRQSRCDEIVVVVGDAVDQIVPDVRGSGVRIVVNERYREGMGTSIAAGISALPPACEAAVILLGDQPRVTGASIDALLDAFRTTGKPIVASRYGAVTGVPALIGRALFDEARRLGGDVGARSLIDRHPDLVDEVPLSPDLAADLDTPEEFARARAAIETDPRGVRERPQLVPHDAIKVVTKPWGREIWWAVTDRYLGKRIEVRAGHALSLQYHRRKLETLYVLSGRARVHVDGRDWEPPAGSALTLPPGTVHRIEAIDDLVLFEVSTPDPDDVVRLEDRYGRAPTEPQGTDGR